VRHAIRDLLDVINLEARRVGNSDVMSRRHGALTDVLTDQEEILPNKSQPQCWSAEAIVRSLTNMAAAESNAYLKSNYMLKYQ